MSSAGRGSQINIFGIDKISRTKFKNLCKRLGYPMNDVFLEIIEFALEDDNNLRRFFQGASKRDRQAS